MADVRAIAQNIRHLNVLFVDDEEDIRVGSAKFLNKFFDTIYICNDGQEGLETFTAHNDIDVIIADIKMPRLSGVAMVRKIQAQKPGVFIVFVTASRGEHKLQKSDYHLYIKKPLGYDEIIFMMEEIQSYYAPPSVD